MKNLIISIHSNINKHLTHVHNPTFPLGSNMTEQWVAPPTFNSKSSTFAQAIARNTGGATGHEGIVGGESKERSLQYFTCVYVYDQETGDESLVRLLCAQKRKPHRGWIRFFEPKPLKIKKGTDFRPPPDNNPLFVFYYNPEDLTQIVGAENLHNVLQVRDLVNLAQIVTSWAAKGRFQGQGAIKNMIKKATAGLSPTARIEVGLSYIPSAVRLAIENIYFRASHLPPEYTILLVVCTDFYINTLKKKEHSARIQQLWDKITSGNSLDVIQLICENIISQERYETYVRFNNTCPLTKLDPQHAVVIQRYNTLKSSQRTIAKTDVNIDTILFEMGLTRPYDAVYLPNTINLVQEDSSPITVPKHFINRANYIIEDIETLIEHNMIQVVPHYPTVGGCENALKTAMELVPSSREPILFIVSKTCMVDDLSAYMTKIDATSETWLSSVGGKSTEFTKFPLRACVIIVGAHHMSLDMWYKLLNTSNFQNCEWILCGVQDACSRQAEIGSDLFNVWMQKCTVHLPEEPTDHASETYKTLFPKLGNADPETPVVPERVADLLEESYKGERTYKPTLYRGTERVYTDKVIKINPAWCATPYDLKAMFEAVNDIVFEAESVDHLLKLATVDTHDVITGKMVVPFLSLFE